MSALRRFKAYVLGQSDIHVSAEELRNASVPVSEGDCRYCADPCDQGKVYDYGVQLLMVN